MASTRYWEDDSPRFDCCRSTQRSGHERVYRPGLRQRHAGKRSPCDCSAEAAVSGASGGGVEPREQRWRTLSIRMIQQSKPTKPTSQRQTNNSKFVEGSLKLTLGCIDGGGSTNIPIPKPDTLSSVSSTQKIGNFYKSYTKYSVSATKISSLPALQKAQLVVDNNKFAKTLSSLPYFIPSIVRAEGDQMISATDGTNMRRGVQHAAACAQPFNVYDPKPAPGILSVSFPDGRPPEIASLSNVCGLSLNSCLPPPIRKY